MTRCFLSETLSDAELLISPYVRPSVSPPTVIICHYLNPLSSHYVAMAKVQPLPVVMVINHSAWGGGVGVLHMQITVCSGQTDPVLEFIC